MTYLRRSNFATKAWFTYISKRQSDFAILQGFNFHETSQMRSFVEIIPRENFIIYNS